MAFFETESEGAMTVCCELERDTNYCPDCGVRLFNSRYLDLLAHIAANVSKAKGQLQVAERCLEKCPTESDSEWWLKQIQRRRKALAKWSDWEDFLKVEVAELLNEYQIARLPAHPKSV